MSLSHQRSPTSGEEGAVVDIATSLEAFNFDSMNPYVEGNNDVAADDSSAALFKMDGSSFQEDVMNHTMVYEFWIEILLEVREEIRIVVGLPPDHHAVDSAEDLIDLPDRLGGTSSIMPQKKNPIITDRVLVSCYFMMLVKLIVPQSTPKTATTQISVKESARYCRQ